MVWTRMLSSCLLVCAVAGCSDDGVVAADGETAQNTSGPDSGATASDSFTAGGSSGGPTDPTVASSAGDTDGAATGDADPTGGSDDSGSSGEPTPGTLPEPEATAGVAYVAHFLSNELRWYRTDGDAPTAGGAIDLGDVTHDTAIDRVNDRLVVAQDVARRVLLFSLDRPEGPEDVIDDPAPLGSIDLATAPRFVRVDPYHERLYILADDTRGGTNMMLLSTVDLADPQMPIVISEVAVPASTSWDVDGPRQLLVLFHGQTDEVFAYDVRGDEPVQLGEPVDLRVPYPEENSTAFQPRALTLDPWNARLYAARSQSANSELIVMEYPAAVPGDGQGYGDVAQFSLEAVADPFDLSVDIAKRPGILDAFTPLPSPTDTLVFMTAAAWNGTLPSATLVTFSGEGPLDLEPGCEDHEGFGCFLREYDAGTPIGFAQTDGAACRDWTHGVVVTTVLGSPEGEPGQVAFFQYEDDGATGPWLSDGDNLPAAAFPVSTACH